MTKMIKNPGGIRDKYKDVKIKFESVKEDNKELIERARHMEGADI